MGKEVVTIFIAASKKNTRMRKHGYKPQHFLATACLHSQAANTAASRNHTARTNTAASRNTLVKLCELQL